MANKADVLTKEEICTGVYVNGDVPTVPENVAATTGVDELNLNWSEKDLPERIRTKHVHRLHPYLGKFIPQLAEVFMRKYFKPGMTILDPFAGSGTALIQANELNINSIGFDISAFNVLLMRAKTHNYDLGLVKKEIKDIMNTTTAFCDSIPQQLEAIDSKHKFSGDSCYSDNAYINDWFAPQARKELLTYRELIKNYQHQDILKVILSRSARSARLTTHFDLDFPKTPQTEPYWCYKHSRTCKPTTTAHQFIKRYSIDTIRRLEEFAKYRTNAKIDIVHGDSQTEAMPKVDGVFTSPPYVGLIDYHDQHRYAYELLSLQDKSALEIGAAKNGSSQKARIEYQAAIANVFRRIEASMVSGGYIIVVAGDKHDLYKDIANMCGVKEETIINRHVNRRTGRRANNFYESVFVWRKP